jgi:outer membrane murein-binding lipoprotein Lpp/uncharacterized Zn ribbon protein
LNNLFRKFIYERKTMKKFCIVLAVLAALVLAGCASSGGGSSSGGGAAGDVYSVDLSTLTIIQEVGDKLNMDAAFKGTKNADPLARSWRWFVAEFDTLPANITDYQRVTIRIQCYDADGNEMKGADSNAQVIMFYDLNGELHKDGDPNLVFKEMNVGGFSGLLDKERGVRTRLKAPPQGIVLQAAQNEPKFIEVTEITFHNDKAPAK